jgi:hypothetical protein
VAYPPLIEKAEKYKIFFQEKGITINFSPFLGYYNGKHYPESYRDEELRVFGLDHTSRAQFNLRGKICNAGYNVAIVSSAGAINICHQIQEKIGDIYKEIKFKDELVTCPFDFCSCPLKIYDSYLFERAFSETG